MNAKHTLYFLLVLSLSVFGCGSEESDDGAAGTAGTTNAAGSGGAAGAGEGGEAGQTSEVDVLALLESACGICHAATFPTLSTLAEWPGLASQQSSLPIITAGDHMSSYLYHKLAGTHTDAPANGSGLTMPMGSDAMTEAQLAAFAEWIDGL